MISVIVPFYNTAPYLERCIESILVQSYKDLDIILVNDGSTDDSLAIAESYKNRDKRIRVVSQENQGLIAARKTGLREARGEWVTFVDSDDWVEADYYLYMDSIACKKVCDLISTGILHEYMGGNPYRVVDLYDEGYYSDISTEIYPTMIYSFKKGTMGLKCNLVNKLFRRKLLEETYQSIDASVFYGEDALTVYSYILQCKSLYISHKCFYHYCTRYDSMCFSQDERLLANANSLFKNLKRKFSQNENARILLPQLERYIIGIYFHALKTQVGVDVMSYAKWDFGRMTAASEKKFILYGAGSCGKAFYRKICSLGLEGNIVKWVDKDPNSEDKKYYGVGEIEEAKDSEYNTIIIAIKDESIARNVMAELNKEWGVPYEKMIWDKMNYSWLI